MQQWMWISTPYQSLRRFFASLAGGQLFLKLDLSQAYQQLLLMEKSKDLTTINLSRPISVYPASLWYCICTGHFSKDCRFHTTRCSASRLLHWDDNYHLANLQQVFQRLQDHGLHLKRDKWVYEGFCRISWLPYWCPGLTPCSHQGSSYCYSSPPTNPQQLKSFLGLLTYYGKFILNLATLTHPLNRLLHADTEWVWDDACQEVFTQAKMALMSSSVLAHYNSTLPLTLAADASAYGLGAVISHTYLDSTEHPVAFSSHTLTSSECNYAQFEKKALGLVFGVKKFHQYPSMGKSSP